MKSGQVTIKDIAKHLGISVATVSRALRNLPDIRPETKKSVLDLAAEWDYEPNQVALNLVKSKTKTIGVIVPNMGYHFFSSAINGIEEEAIQYGYSVLVTQSNESYLRELTNIQDLSRGQVDGIIVSVSRETSNYDHFKRLIKKGIPLVFFDRDIGNIDVSKVVIDNVSASKKAVNHLIENGFKKIAILAGPSFLELSHQRVEGYKEALLAAGLSLEKTFIVHGDYSHENAVNLTRELLSLPNPPDAIFALSDRLAIGAMMAIKSMGLKIPENVAVVGFNDEPISSFVTPTLSTIGQPSTEIGRIATRLLLDQLKNKNESCDAQKIVVETELIIRESSRRIN